MYAGSSLPYIHSAFWILLVIKQRHSQNCSSVKDRVEKNGKWWKIVHKPTMTLPIYLGDFYNIFIALISKWV